MSSTALLSSDGASSISSYQISKRQKIAQALELTGLFFSKPVHIASKPLIRALATPICPGQDGNLSSYSLELIWRIFVVTICIITAPITIPLALIGAGMEKIADIVNHTPYTHWKGTAKEQEDTGNYRLMTLNGCMLWGGLPIMYGGMRPPSDRMDQLASKIRAADPDVFVMQEMSFDASYQLYSKLKGNYANFFTRIGPNPPMMESGLFVASKYPINNAGFILFPDQTQMKRGAFWIETPKSFVFTTHMEFGHTEKDANMRKEQFEMIWNQIEECKKRKPCFLLGDFNIDRSKTKEYDVLEIEEKFHDPYLTEHPIITAESSTCTNEISAHVLGEKAPDNPWELDDYALLAKGDHRYKLDSKLLQMYDNNKPDKALSDHRGLLLTATA
ncbi:MAG: hypothetical protein KR126chlam3_01224 [Chlamydiae bacterium]|nr:hypothetical protein [Chlamydiota bacterium]